MLLADRAGVAFADDGSDLASLAASITANAEGADDTELCDEDLDGATR